MAFSIDLSCPKCGEKLEVPDGSGYIVCSHCDAEFIVKNEGELVSLNQLDGAASQQAIQKLEQEIADLTRTIQETTAREGYKKNVFYGITLIVSVLFSIASYWAWKQYGVTIWIVFFIAGICIAVVSGIAVKLQSMEYQEQTKKLAEMINPYQVALTRKQKELSFYQTATGSKKKKVSR